MRYQNYSLATTLIHVFLNNLKNTLNHAPFYHLRIELILEIYLIDQEFYKLYQDLKIHYSHQYYKLPQIFLFLLKNLLRHNDHQHITNL